VAFTDNRIAGTQSGASDLDFLNTQATRSTKNWVLLPGWIRCAVHNNGPQCVRIPVMRTGVTHFLDHRAPASTTDENGSLDIWHLSLRSRTLQGPAGTKWQAVWTYSFSGKQHCHQSRRTSLRDGGCVTAKGNDHTAQITRWPHRHRHLALWILLKLGWASTGSVRMSSSRWVCGGRFIQN
jgi:hypothetical protein